MNWTYDQLCFHYWQGQAIYLSSEVSTQALGPPSPLFNWYWGFLPWGSRGRVWTWQLTPIQWQVEEWVELYHHSSKYIHCVHRNNLRILILHYWWTVKLPPQLLHFITIMLCTQHRHYTRCFKNNLPYSRRLILQSIYTDITNILISKTEQLQH
jgi:hypothetical protein